MADTKFDLRGVVREQIVAMIGNMDIQKSSKLPAEQQLAKQLQVSRSTIRTVLDGLEDEGKVIRRHGSGTYVNTHAFSAGTTLYPQVYYNELIERSGYVPSIEILGLHILPPGKIGEKLDLGPQDEMIELAKIYRANGKVCIYCIDYLGTRIVTPELKDALKVEAVSIFQFLAEHTSVSFAWDIAKLEATDSREIPEVEGYWDMEQRQIKPLLLIETLNYDIDNKPVLFSKSYVDTDVIKYQLLRHNFSGEEKSVEK